MKYDEVRDEIMELAMEMERIMRKHDETKGDSWKEMPIEDLRMLVSQELNEWYSAISRQSISDERYEIVDAIITLMMVRHRLGEKS